MPMLKFLALRPVQCLFLFITMSLCPGCGGNADTAPAEGTGGHADEVKDSGSVNTANDDDTLLQDLTAEAFVDLCKETAGMEDFRRAICSYQYSVSVRSEAESDSEYIEQCQAETETCVGLSASFCDDAPLPTVNCESTVGEYRDCMRSLYETWVSLGDCSDGLDGPKIGESVIPSVVCGPYIAVCLAGR